MEPTVSPKSITTPDHGGATTLHRVGSMVCRTGPFPNYSTLTAILGLAFSFQSARHGLGCLSATDMARHQAVLHATPPDTLRQSIESLLTISLLQPEDYELFRYTPSISRPFSEVVENSRTQPPIQNSEPMPALTSRNTPVGKRRTLKTSPAVSHRLLHSLGNEGRNRLAHLLRKPTPPLYDSQQPSVKRRQEMPFEALKMLRICSAALFTHFAIAK
jgi:hypothetical protein